MEKNGSSLYGADRCQPTRCRFGSFSRKGNTLYLHAHYWPGETVAFAGLLNKVKSAKLLATGQPVKFDQDEYRVRFTGLPTKAPDTPIATIAMECDGEAKQDQLFVRRRERGQV
jgi:alpha-L-fucosidase